MTRARLGSQPPRGIAPKSRKPRTFAGATISETVRPAPKTRPATRATTIGMPQPPIAWRSTKTVAAPAAGGGRGGGRDQSRHEGELQRRIAGAGPQQPAQDAADPGHAAKAEHIN